MKKKLLCTALVVVFLFCFASCGGSGGEEIVSRSENASDAASAQGLQTVDEALPFSVQTLSGDVFTQDDLAAYDLTVLNVWATYCPPCLAEMPDLASLGRALPANVNLITYCLDAGDQRIAAEKIVADAGLSAPVLITADGLINDLLSKVMYIPTTFFLDSAGNPVGDPIVGGTNEFEKVFNTAIDQRLSELGKARQ